MKTTSTLVDLEKPLVKDGDADDIDVHLYRSMIGSLMYLTTSMPDIMFACKKQIVVATSTTEAEYVAAASCYGQIFLQKVLMLEATASTNADGKEELTVRIDGQVKTISEASLRRHLKLEDSDGLTSLPNTKIFEQLALMGNMKRASRSYFRVDIPLFPTMITTTKSSPSRITSSPSLSPQTHQLPQSSPLRDITRHTAKIPQSQFPTQTYVADKATFISVDVDTKGAATTNISLDAGQGIGTIHKSPTRPHDTPLPRVYTLGSDEGSLQQNELTNLDKDAEEDSSKQEDAEIQEKNNTDTEILLEEEDPTELVEDHSSGEKGDKEVSTAHIAVTTAEAELSIVSPPTAEDISGAETLVYIRRSASKDKGKTIMTKPKHKQTTTKLKLRQERAGLEVAKRLQEQLNEEESQRIARDAEIARQLQEEINIVGQEKVVAEADQSHDINWNDPIVIRFHAHQNRPFFIAEVRKNMCMYLKNQGGYKQSHFKGMSFKEVRHIFEKVWDQNHTFIPKDSEIEKEVMKRPGFDLQQKQLAKRQKIGEVSGSSEEQSAKKEVSEEELQKMLVIVPVEEVYIEALQRFDRDDLEKLWDLVKKRFSLTEPTVDKEKVLWVKLKRLFEPDNDDTLQKLQRYMHDPLKWRLYNTCGVHHVSTEKGHDIFMLVEKDYSLTRALMTVMLANKLQVDEL
ncbi:hypothetical protein Tco_0712201 [Tanacetum coccineum]